MTTMVVKSDKGIHSLKKQAQIKQFGQSVIDIYFFQGTQINRAVDKIGAQ